jgi:hypothetical protein
MEMKAMRLTLTRLGQFVRSIEKILPPSTSADPDPAPSLDEDEAPAEPESMKVLEGNSTFAHLVVWGHDTLPAGNDPFVKGVEEWVAFAEMVSGCLVLNLNGFRDANG